MPNGGGQAVVFGILNLAIACNRQAGSKIIEEIIKFLQYRGSVNHKKHDRHLPWEKK
jgi:hypothetical protein